MYILLEIMFPLIITSPNPTLFFHFNATYRLPEEWYKQPNCVSQSKFAKANYAKIFD